MRTVFVFFGAALVFSIPSAANHGDTEPVDEMSAPTFVDEKSPDNSPGTPEKSQVCEGKVHQAQCPASRRWPFGGIGSPPRQVYSEETGHPTACIHGLTLYGTQWANARPVDADEKARLRRIYGEALAALKQGIEQQSQWSPEVRSRMQQTLQNVRFVEDGDPFYRSLCGPGGVNTAAFSAGRIAFCPGLVRFVDKRAEEAGTDGSDAIYFIMAHELGHSLGFNTSPFSAQFAKMNECYRSKYGNSQMSENTADAFGALAVARRAQAAGKDRFKVVNGAGQPFCNRPADAAHASGEFRTNRNIVLSPDVQRLFECTGKPVCGLSGEVSL